MFRYLLLLLGTLSAHRPGRREAAWYCTNGAGASTGPGARYLGPADPANQADGGGRHEWNGPAIGTAWPKPPEPPEPTPAPDQRAVGRSAQNPGGAGKGRRPGRRRVSPRLKWGAFIVAAGLIFRRAIAATVLMALSAALHLVGLSVHLPSIRFAWPWQTISRGTTTNTDLGPWVLQKIEGISKPALGEVTFNFLFTHKVSKSIGFWPCWYAATFHAVGHASATVDLNPGPAWWSPARRHYRLRVLSRPQAGKPGQVTVAMVLPRPQLPTSAHDVTIDNIPSGPVATHHSWTYPGFGCGVLLRPQFSDSVLYAQAQRIAFYRASRVPQVTRPLIRTAETEAVQTIRDNFVQPTLNAVGYKLAGLTVRWAAAP